MLRLDINLLWTVINLLIWYVLIRKFLFKPVNDIISKREDAIKSRYAEAKELQNAAQAEKDKCTKFQAEIEEERNRAVAKAQEDARVEYDRILGDAKNQADQIVEASRKEAKLEKEKILNKAEQEIRSLIMDTAVRSMQTGSDDGALYDQFLTKAGETGHAEH